MQKFEGKIIFEDERIKNAFIWSFAIVVFIALLVFIFRGFESIDSDSIPLVFIGIIFGCLAIYAVAYAIGGTTSCKEMRFEIQSLTGLKIFKNKEKMFDGKNFEFYGYIQARGGRGAQLFFCLCLIILHRDQDRFDDTEYLFVERIDDYQKIKGVDINPDIPPFMLTSRTVDPFPNFIFETFQALKEFEKTRASKTEDVSVNSFDPFNTSNTTTLEEKTNLKRWNELVDANSRSKMYNLPEFKSNSEYLALDKIEKNAFGDVADKSLLHLQCHFGMSTLSFARMGAEVTGVDFSDKAITLARSLSKELSIPANFVQSNIFDLKENLTGKFDYVFTSYGVLCWLKDIDKWGEIVSHFLRPGGTFFIVEFHPFGYLFDGESGEMKVKYKYFSDGTPQGYDDDRSYADGTIIKNSRSYEWVHTLGDIINSLIKAGLTIKEFKEYDYIGYNSHKFLKKVADREYRAEGDPIPLVFSIKATK